MCAHWSYVALFTLESIEDTYTNSFENLGSAMWNQESTIKLEAEKTECTKDNKTRHIF